jgi:riboflavin synthase alpha subunit
MFNDASLDWVELCSTSSLQGIAQASLALRLLRSSVLMDVTKESGIVTVNGYGLTVKDLRKPDSILATSVN